MLQAVVSVFAVLVLAAFPVASAMPCPMSEGMQRQAHTHTAHSSGNCPDHRPERECEHSSFADCLDLQEAVSNDKNPVDEKKQFPAIAQPRLSHAFIETRLPQIKADSSPGGSIRRYRKIFLLTRRIAV